MMLVPTWPNGDWKRHCSFSMCRFCGVMQGSDHLEICNWTNVHNPIPEVLFGTDEDWFNVEIRKEQS